jgi:hypothetical protein
MGELNPKTISRFVAECSVRYTNEAFDINIYMFNELVDSILSMLEEETYHRNQISPSVKSNLKQAPSEAIVDLSQVKKRIMRLLPRSITMQNSEAQTESWSTRLFRGHKNIDPFSKTGDSKAQGQGVFWAKDLKTALLYSTAASSWGTSGQQYVNIAQQAFAGDAAGDALQVKYKLGYISIAQPKQPEKLKWYKNFGYEDDLKQRQDVASVEREKFYKQNPNKLFPGLPDDYKFVNKYKYTQDEYNREHQRQSSFAGNDPKILQGQGETVLSRDQVNKVRTYLIYDGAHMISIETIKQYDPMLFNVLLKDKI